MKGFAKIFRKKIENKKIRIAVVGLGYVGLPLAIEFARKGFFVLGIDLDYDRITRIRRKQSYIVDITNGELRKVIASGKFKAENKFSGLKEADAVIICVPTPLKRKYNPDISFILGAVKQVKEFLHYGQLIVLESTTYPGTTEEVIRPLLEDSGLECGKDFYLAFSPERIDPGNARYPVNKIPKVIGGVTRQATELTASLYRNIIDKVVPVSSARVAEAVKLMENTFRIVNIGLIDEMAMMCHKMGLDIWEIIDAASTKPFGFMPFYPGPGVGGHCLDKNESIFIKEEGSLKIMQMPDFLRYVRGANRDNIEVLSFDPLKKQSVFKAVTAASARYYSGQMIDITTQDGRHLKVTDLHPMFVYHDKSWQLKYAKDLQRGDFLPIPLRLPPFPNNFSRIKEVDLIEQILQNGQHLIDKIRVKPIGSFWKDYSQAIKLILLASHKNKLPGAYWDYLSSNALPLKYFYALEKKIKINHHRLKLVTGRGPSYSEMPARIVLNKDFCRLIGYYLSEGCYTKDSSSRIRFSFNRNEKEYIEDVINILKSLGIRSSVYESKMWRSSCIKVSSNLFGFLIYNILGCGNNCYNTSIPEQFFSLNRENKKALLGGILRGDGCVEHFFGKWRYRKNGKEYLHNVNTASVSFFTASKKLFQQIIILLHDLGIVPTFRKRKYSISIFGYKQLAFLKDLFEGRKKDIIAQYLILNKNRPKNKTFRKVDKFAVVRVKSVSETKGDWVYSIETDKPHSFVTSYGIAVHNCIPKDPLYLYWKARQHGFKSKFIKLASQVINFMPQYVISRIAEILAKQALALNQANILVIGVTYKKDVKDLRKSPALDIIDILQKNNVSVSYSDPLIPYLKLNHEINLKSINLSPNNLGRFDVVIIATDHSSLDYGFILKNSRLIFDTRNAYRKINNSKVYKL